MGSFHGAEVCDIVVLFLLDKLSDIFDKNAYGLYRDDGLVVIDWASPRELDSLRKKTIATMLEVGYKITIDVGQRRRTSWTCL